MPSPSIVKGIVHSPKSRRGHGRLRDMAFQSAHGSATLDFHWLEYGEHIQHVVANLGLLGAGRTATTTSRVPSESEDTGMLSDLWVRSGRPATAGTPHPRNHPTGRRAGTLHTYAPRGSKRPHRESKR